MALYCAKTSAGLGHCRSREKVLRFLLHTHRNAVHRILEKKSSIRSHDAEQREEEENRTSVHAFHSLSYYPRLLNLADNGPKMGYNPFPLAHNPGRVDNLYHLEGCGSLVPVHTDHNHSHGVRVPSHDHSKAFHDLDRTVELDFLVDNLVQFENCRSL